MHGSRPIDHHGYVEKHPPCRTGEEEYKNDRGFGGLLLTASVWKGNGPSG
jgi:hypothetical protein